MSLTKIFTFICLCTLGGISCKEEKDTAMPHKYNFYVGTYTQKEGHVDGKGKGIYDVTLDIDSAKITINKIITDLVNPSFLVAVDSHNILTVNELSPNPQNFPGRISRLEITADGQYRKAQEAGTYGNAPCHISYCPSTQMYASANYLGGQLIYGSVNEKGELRSDLTEIVFTGKSIHPRQEASHLHMTHFTQDGSRLLVSDLGADKIYVMEVDTQTKKIAPKPLSIFSCTPGSGPRHFCMDKDEKMLYVLNELTNTIVSCTFEKSTGMITKKAEISTLSSQAATTKLAAHIVLSPDSKYLVSSNRGENNLAVFTLNQSIPEKPVYVSTDGKTPRHFTFTRDGKYLIAGNQDSDNLTIYEWATGGKLHKKFNVELPTPVCIVEK
ncbi:MAG TPA: lactonase family protein [Saprospiraceae bacterium]|nr:lactonase family protein [Saprospiraceae bacterium]